MPSHAASFHSLPAALRRSSHPPSSRRVRTILPSPCLCEATSEFCQNQTVITVGKGSAQGKPPLPPVLVPLIPTILFLPFSPHHPEIIEHRTPFTNSADKRKETKQTIGTRRVEQKKKRQQHAEAGSHRGPKKKAKLSSVLRERREETP